jgi:hypothetical protein
MFMVTLAIPDNALHGLSAKFAAELTRKYEKNDKKLFQYTIAASNHYLILRDTDTTESVIFLTDGTISSWYTEFRQTWLVKDFEETARYYSPELTLGRWPDQGSDRQTPLTHRELTGKIELNKAFRDELKYKIRSLKWSQLTALKFNFGYIPTHYMVRMTSLRFVEVPKIRTITSFGERVVMENSWKKLAGFMGENRLSGVFQIARMLSAIFVKRFNELSRLNGGKGLDPATRRGFMGNTCLWQSFNFTQRGGNSFHQRTITWRSMRVIREPMAQAILLQWILFLY